MPDPTSYDDPLDIDWNYVTIEQEHAIKPTVAVPTGLNEEEDASRFLQFQFDPHVMFCPNCEGYFDNTLMASAGDLLCPTCNAWYLKPVGTRPRKFKV